MTLKSKVGMARGPVPYRQKQSTHARPHDRMIDGQTSSCVVRPNWNAVQWMTESLWNKYDISRKSPEVPIKRSPKVVRKERALALNAPWDSTAIGWKIYELVRPVYSASLRLYDHFY